METNNPILAEVHQVFVAVDRVHPEKAGTYAELIDITKQSAPENRKLFQKLAADSSVASYQTYEVSSVHLPDGEILTGQPKNHTPLKAFGHIVPITEIQPSRTSLTTEFDAENAERIASMKEWQLNQGYTHWLYRRGVGPHPIKQGENIIICNPKTGIVIDFSKQPLIQSPDSPKL